MTGTGHRTVPHTADLRIEAWAPDREECLAEAVRALVDSFADVAGARPRRFADVRIAAGADPDLLVAILDEVIYRIDAQDEIPVEVAVRAEHAEVAGAEPGEPAETVRLSLGLAGLESVGITGAAPKAVSLSELRCAPEESGRWLASATIDV